MEYCPGNRKTTILWNVAIPAGNIDNLKSEFYCDYCFKNCVGNTIKENNLCSIILSRTDKICCCPKLEFHNIKIGYKCPPCQLISEQIHLKDDKCIHCEEKINVGKICIPCSNIDKKCFVCGKKIQAIENYLQNLSKIISDKFKSELELDPKNIPYSFFRELQGFHSMLQKIMEMENIFRYSNIENCLKFCFGK